MRIFDENDNELTEEEADLNYGHLEDDRIFIQHHEAQEGQEGVYHYKVLTFYFEDGGQYSPTDENDPHVKIIDAGKSLFDYISLEGEEPHVMKGADVEQVIEVPHIEARDAWDEYEDIKRYILYTEEELEEIQKEKEKEEKKARLLEMGWDLLEYTSVNVEDIILTMADLAGGGDVEEEVE